MSSSKFLLTADVVCVILLCNMLNYFYEVLKQSQKVRILELENEIWCILLENDILFIFLEINCRH